MGGSVPQQFHPWVLEEEVGAGLWEAWPALGLCRELWLCRGRMEFGAVGSGGEDARLLPKQMPGLSWPGDYLPSLFAGSHPHRLCY